MERLQALVNSYVGGLEVTGRGYQPSKCHQWHIGFSSKSGEYSYLHANNASTEINLPGIVEAIKKLDPNESKEGIEVVTAPYCSTKDHLEELGGKV